MSAKTQNRRLQHFYLKLQLYHFCIMYRKGCNNRNADGLSWQSWEADKPQKMMCANRRAAQRQIPSNNLPQEQLNSEDGTIYQLGRVWGKEEALSTHKQLHIWT